MKTIDTNQQAVRVLVVDDQRTIRQTIRSYLEPNSQIEVVGLAEDGVSALEKIAELQPDIAVIDLEMPGMNGITTIEIINERFPETKTLILSSRDQQEYIQQAIVAGAKGYLLKGCSEEKLTEAVLKVSQGYFQLDAKLSAKVSLDFQRNLGEEYLSVDIDKIDHLPSEDEEKAPAAVSEDLTAMRREIVDILEFKIHLLESKKNQINLSFQKLQRKFSWLLASQLVLFFLVLGSTSSMLKMKQQSQVNVQNVKVVNTSQLVK